MLRPFKAVENETCNDYIIGRHVNQHKFEVDELDPYLDGRKFHSSDVFNSSKSKEK